jgi:hypothetical protein
MAARGRLRWRSLTGYVRRFSTFAPADRTCTSACALIWLAGVPRTVGDTPHIGFHALYGPTTGRETGSGNAVIGGYLGDLGLGYKANVFMTRKGPTSVEWLTPELAKEFSLTWEMLWPSRAIPIPPQPKLQPRLQPPPQVVEGWSKWASSSSPQPPPIFTRPMIPPPAPAPKQASPVPPALQSPSALEKTQERFEPESQRAKSSPLAGDDDNRRDANPAYKVLAQKVVLYEEEPADPNGKRFVGSAIWRTEMVTLAPGQPPEFAIRADIEVPERNLAMTWLLRRNTDKSLHATHTVEINFKLPADFPLGGFSNVPAC